MSNKQKLVSQSRAAKALHRKRQTIADWIKRGAPVHAGGKVCVEELKAWELTQRPGPILPHLAKVERETSPDTTPATVQAELDAALTELANADGLDAALKRLQHCEKVAFRLLTEAQGRGTGEQGRARLHADAVSAVLKAEALRDCRQEIRTEEQGKMLDALTAWFAPLKALIDQLPRSMASRCNVADPASAESALRDWVLSQFYPLASNKPTPRE